MDFFHSSYFANCRTLIILLPVLWKILNHSFRILESLHCNFNNVENSNCTYLIVENITRCLTLEHIVNHFFHISSIQPIDLCGLPQILVEQKNGENLENSLIYGVFLFEEELFWTFRNPIFLAQNPPISVKY